jgi:glutathione S-transferase
VPALRTEAGEVLTENAAVLQWLAETWPQAGLLPDDAPARARVRQWLGFVGTELHKAVFVPLLDPQASPDVKAYARDKAALRLGVLDAHLRAHEHLAGDYGIADIYLTVVLNWAPFAGIDLASWPAVQAWQRRIGQRPAVARALQEEFALYQAEQRRRAS